MDTNVSGGNAVVGSEEDPEVVLIGVKPRAAWQTLSRMGIRFMLLTDDVDGAVDAAVGATRVHTVPFKADPLSVLGVPIPGTVTAVLSFTELGLLPAALLSEALDLPTVPVLSVLRTRDKLLMRRALDKHVAQPAFGVVGVDEPDGPDFPVVVKPIDGSGSRGVEYVADLQCYARRSAAFQGYLWEHFVDGDEYSVEAVSVDGTHHILGITEKVTTGPPYFIETGHFVPAAVSTTTGGTIRHYVRTCLDRLGVTLGASHTEVKIRRGQVLLIEMHTRAGGDRIPLLTRLVTGYDQYQMAVESVLAPGTRWLPSADRRAAAGIRYFPWQNAILQAVVGLDACARADGIVEVELQAKPGERIPLWRYSHERPGYVLVHASSRAELVRRLDAAQQLVVAEFVDTRPAGVGDRMALSGTEPGRG